MHVLDVSNVFDCAHSSTSSSSAIPSKHTNATKTIMEKRHTHSKNKTKIGSAVDRKNIKTNGQRKCKDDNPKEMSETTVKETDRKDEHAVSKSTVWTQVVQTVQDTQNVVMMAVILVVIYLFCYDKNVRT